MEKTKTKKSKRTDEYVGSAQLAGVTYSLYRCHALKLDNGKSANSEYFEGKISLSRRLGVNDAVQSAAGAASSIWRCSIGMTEGDSYECAERVMIGTIPMLLKVTRCGTSSPGYRVDFDMKEIRLHAQGPARTALAAVMAVDAAWRTWRNQLCVWAIRRASAPAMECLPESENAEFEQDYRAAKLKIASEGFDGEVQS